MSKDSDVQRANRQREIERLNREAAQRRAAEQERKAREAEIQRINTERAKREQERLAAQETARKAAAKKK